MDTLVRVVAAVFAFKELNEPSGSLLKLLDVTASTPPISSDDDLGLYSRKVLSVSACSCWCLLRKLSRWFLAEETRLCLGLLLNLTRASEEDDDVSTLLSRFFFSFVLEFDQFRVSLSTDLPRAFNCPTQNEYLIISAAKANVMQKLHKPVLKSQRLLDKTSWTGNLEAMQYFATLNYFNQTHDELVSQTENDEDEFWLSDEIIDSSAAIPRSPKVANSPSLYQQSPKTTVSNNESFYDFDALSNSSDLSVNINDNDITSSSSSTDLNKIYKNKVI